MTAAYIGRFAPSPTGPLHHGSLIAALASFLDARANRGHWLLRIEDIDPPREPPGAAEQIIACLRAHALHWDGDIIWQSRRLAAYHAAINQLLTQQDAFYCDCSRARIKQLGGRYDGHCRERKLAEQHCAVRAKVSPHLIRFEDGIQGWQQENLADTVGDFVIRRRDGLIAYQLAVVVDDAASDVTHIVRGSDLLDSTGRQRHLQQQLALTSPRYYHLPVLLNAQGQKLSKQTFAPALDQHSASDNLIFALRKLGQALPPLLAKQSPQAIIDWAIAHWNIDLIGRQMTLDSA